MPVDDDEVGKHRRGRYELRAKIAQGGMAEVYLAVARGPGGFEKIVAIKQLLPHLEDEPGFIEMFFDEARIAASLSHPNICQIFELGQDHGRHYLAMEYLPGQSLRRVWKRSIKQGVSLPPLVSAYIVARAAEGLAYAHDKVSIEGKPLRIVHRDISPENIVVTYDGQVKVVDFGISHAANRISRTRTGFLRGKIAYMAPEQIRREPVDARSDVFSLGVVLHELLTGRPLFQDVDDLATMQHVLEAPIPPPIVPGIDKSFIDTLQQASERNIDARLASAREFQERLDRALAHANAPISPKVLSDFLGSLFLEERTKEEVLLQTASIQVSEKVVGLRDSEAGTTRNLRPDRATRRVSSTNSPIGSGPAQLE